MHKRLTIAALLILLPIAAGAATPPPLPSTEDERRSFADTVCSEIDDRASEHGLPQSFIARLIWKESLFDPGAVSPKGAQGIAQFMPGTAKLRGLDDPFDAKKALAASAAYLAELRTRFGNLGRELAAFLTRRRTTSFPSPAMAMRNGRRKTPASTSPRWPGTAASPSSAEAW